MVTKKWKWMMTLFVVFLTTTIMNAQSKDSLDIQQQSLIKISALTAVGKLEPLKIQLNKGLDNGLTINEIKEELVQLYAYCGFPRSLNAINTFKTVVEERKAKGIKDVDGKKIIVINTPSDKYEQGRKMLEELTRTAQLKPAPGFGEFAPRIDAFLKEHLFADIFVSDVLSYQQRELVTIAALASIPGVDGQLQSHINMGKNTGITVAQLEQLANLVEIQVSITQANTVRQLIGKQLVPLVKPEMMVRISEIEILPEYLEEYNAILKQEATASVKLEAGVIAIFPMYQKENPTQIRIIEMYADKAGYQSHLKTPHFLHYKTTTLKMVKLLKLVDMESLDRDAMLEIFKKLN
ncbi:carboxymuconolactone decarboxylase family protein [Pedobacter jeongneungensis]|uniref:carboxymuconolactone decarboxylase family protein n=1 Tax=Pedobacter jeongneungensis TaxID=947309 RepID=UPI0004681395|nr:carboxymuconolactone decarboxylase family protein [Pedobacter jeongneungensis]